MSKLQDKISHNFEKELATIRSISRVSSHSRVVTPRKSRDDTFSELSGTHLSKTIISGLTMDDYSQMDFSESDIFKQSNKADMKIKLL